MKKKTPHKPVKYTDEEVQELIEEAIKGIRADKNIIYIYEVIELQKWMNLIKLLNLLKLF